MKLSARVEVTLRDDQAGRTSAAVWGISRRLLARHVGPVLRGRHLVLFGYSSMTGLCDEVVPRLRDATVVGSKSKAAVLTAAPNLLDLLAEDDRGPERFELAALERSATSDDLAEMRCGVDVFDDIPGPREFTLSFSDGAAWVQGPTAPVEGALLRALMERIVGRPCDHQPPAMLGTIAREHGLLLFRDLVERADVVRAVLLHACGWGIVEPLIPRTASDVPVPATEVSIGPGGVGVRDLDARRISEWLGVAGIRLALARGHLRSCDEDWR